MYYYVYKQICTHSSKYPFITEDAVADTDSDEQTCDSRSFFWPCQLAGRAGLSST